MCDVNTSFVYLFLQLLLYRSTIGIRNLRIDKNKSDPRKFFNEIFFACSM